MGSIFIFLYYLIIKKKRSIMSMKYGKLFYHWIKQPHARTHTHTHTHIYIYIRKVYIYIFVFPMLFNVKTPKQTAEPNIYQWPYYLVFFH